MATLCVALLAIAWWSVRHFTGIVVLGVLLAYVLSPIIGWLTLRTRLRRGLVAVFVYLAVAAFAATALFAVAQNVVQAIASGAAERAFDALMAALRDAAPHAVRVLGFIIPVDRWLGPGYEPVVDSLRALGRYVLAPESSSRMLGYATEFATGFAYTALAIIVTFFVSLYVAADGGRCLAWAEAHVPAPYQPVYRHLLAEVDTVWRRFFLGELLLALVIGLMTLGGLLLLGVAYAPALAFIAGVLEIIPRLGPTLSVVPALAVALVLPSTTFPGLSPLWLALAVIALYVVIQQLENNLLVPRILGSSTNVPPVVVLVGALAGAKIAGVPGIFLAPPILGTARVLGRWLFYKLVTEPATACLSDEIVGPGRTTSAVANGETESTPATEA